MIIHFSFFKNDIYIKIMKNPCFIIPAFIVLFFSLKKLNLHIQRDKSRCPLDECHCHGKCTALFTSVTQPRGFVELLIFAKSLHRELFISTQNKPGKPARLVSLFLGLKLLRTYYGIMVSKREMPVSDSGLCLLPLSSVAPWSVKVVSSAVATETFHSRTSQVQSSTWGKQPALSFLRLLSDFYPGHRGCFSVLSLEDGKCYL